MGLIYAYDVGSNSIGYSVLRTGENGEPYEIVEVGAHTFPDSRDAKSNASLAARRRQKRGERRNRDRYKLRRKDLLKALKRAGLMPQEAGACEALKGLDPYELRARGLDRALSKSELGRALFHIHEKRGFRSNRLQVSEDSEAGEIKQAIEHTDVLMGRAGARTYGELLFMRREAEKRSYNRRRGKRPTVKSSPGADGLYPSRHHLEAEVRRLWESQMRFHPDLTQELGDQLFKIIFRQRPLRPVMPGKCAVEHSEFRAPWASPEAQQFRYLQDISHLRVIEGNTERPLTLEERRMACSILESQKEVTFNSLRQKLKLPKAAAFNLEGATKPILKGNATSAILGNIFGPDRWSEMDQSGLVYRLLTEEDEGKLRAELGEFPEDVITKAISASLPSGYARLSLKAIRAILPHLMVCNSFAEACSRAGYQHTKQVPTEKLDHLPYYGTLDALAPHLAEDPNTGEGKIANPTVHRGLNQLRKLTNNLIDKYGKPDRIHLELVRECFTSKKQKKAHELRDKANQILKDQARKECRKRNVTDSNHNLLKYRLFKELPENRQCCIYTGRPITLENLFSAEIEIDHIHPFAASLDDGIGNKVLCARSANRAKARKTPYEAFGQRHLPGFEWEGIEERLRLFSGKGKRVAKTPGEMAWARKAAQRFGKETVRDLMEGESNFLARHLNDTAYISKVARLYLNHIVDTVVTIPGTLTAAFRYAWNLNSILNTKSNRKERVDHRHHAIDALVVGCIDRSMLQRISKAAELDNQIGSLYDLKRAEKDSGLKVPLPWDTFFEDATRAVQRVIVTAKPNHAVSGALLEDTAYGILGDSELVYRVPIEGLSEAQVKSIRDSALRVRVKNFLTNYPGYNKAAPGKPRDNIRAAALTAFSQISGVRTIRIIKKNATAVPIKDKQGRPYKALLPAEIHHIDIFEVGKKWVGKPVFLYEAARGVLSSDTPVLRLHKGDYLELDYEGSRRIFKVVQLDQSHKRINVVEHFKAGKAAKEENLIKVTYNQLRKMSAKLVKLKPGLGDLSSSLKT